MTLARRMIILDRDGVINVDHGYVHTVDQWEWTPGAPEAIRALGRAGYARHIVTNQSGVGRGMYGKDDYFELMAQVSHDYFWHTKGSVTLAERFPGASACFHHPDNDCECRRPKTGLYETDIGPIYGPLHTDECWFVDDKLDNLDFGRQIGFNLAWINPGPDEGPPDAIRFGSLHQFAEELLGRKIPWTKARELTPYYD